MEPNKGDNGRFAKPGDRGDDCQRMGLSSIKTGYSGKLQSEASKGYDEISIGWHGNVKR